MLNPMGGTGPGKHEAAPNATTDRTKRDQYPRYVRVVMCNYGEYFR